MKLKSTNVSYLIPSVGIFFVSFLISIPVVEEFLAFDGIKTEGVLVSLNGFWKGSVVYSYEVSRKKYRGQSGYNYGKKINVGDSVDVYYCRYFPNASSLYKKSPNLMVNVLHLIVFIVAGFLLLILAFVKGENREGPTNNLNIPDAD